MHDEKVSRHVAAGTAVAAGFAREQAGHVVVGGADPERRVPALADEVGQTDVVGVHVRDDDAQDRHTLQLRLEDLLPLRAGLVPSDAAIDHRPALDPVDGIAQQPEVDVIEREGQRHANPTHAGRHCERLADFGEGVAQGVMEFAF